MAPSAGWPATRARWKSPGGSHDGLSEGLRVSILPTSGVSPTTSPGRRCDVRVSGTWRRASFAFPLPYRSRLQSRGRTRGGARCRRDSEARPGVRDRLTSVAPVCNRWHKRPRTDPLVQGRERRTSNNFELFVKIGATLEHLDPENTDPSLQWHGVGLARSGEGWRDTFHDDELDCPAAAQSITRSWILRSAPCVRFYQRGWREAMPSLTLRRFRDCCCAKARPGRARHPQRTAH